MINSICVTGAGTMGRGIALAAAQSGYGCLLYDSEPKSLQSAKVFIESELNQLLNKQKITPAQKEEIIDRVRIINEIKNCRADLLIEAIAENQQAKTDLFKKLESVNDEKTIIATNTSSLSVSMMQKTLAFPGRFAGMHFFNPPAVMKLVEVVKGEHTDEQTLQSVMSVAEKMGKRVIICKDSPGFIVNRVARHYYLESLRLMEQNISTAEDIDQILESSGFRLGPFRLMDLIGIDVNLAVSKSIYDGFDHEVRFRPSPLQEQKVLKNQLGRKTGEGFYKYDQEHTGKPAG